MSGPLRHPDHRRPGASSKGPTIGHHPHRLAAELSRPDLLALAAAIARTQLRNPHGRAAPLNLTSPRSPTRSPPPAHRLARPPWLPGPSAAAARYGAPLIITEPSPIRGISKRTSLGRLTNHRDTPP